MHPENLPHGGQLTGHYDKVYLDSAHPAGFSTPYRLWNEGLRKSQPKKDVVAYLQGQDSYTLHKRVRRRFPRNVTYADTVDDCWQCDLADFSALKEDNDGYIFVFCVNDVFSRYAWTIPLKDKKAITVLEGIKSIFDSTERRPARIISDKGKEIQNNTLKRFLKQQDIELYHTNNPDTKASVTERFIGSLRMFLQKRFTKSKNYRYIDGVLRDVTRAYNHKLHRTLKMTPHEASQPGRVLEVYRNLYSKKIWGARKTKPTFALGDYVRISREKKRFEKGHTYNWSEEIFQISKVIPQIQTVYKITELDTGDEIEGSFYSWELNKVDKPDIFEIDYIAGSRGKGARTEKLVQWRGYPNYTQSWIRAKDILTC